MEVDFVLASEQSLDRQPSCTSLAPRSNKPGIFSTKSGKLLRKNAEEAAELPAPKTEG